MGVTVSYLSIWWCICIRESVPLVVFGVAKIQRVQMLAEFSGISVNCHLFVIVLVLPGFCIRESVPLVG